MEVYLEVDCENLYDLLKMGFEVEIGDEVTCDVDYDIDGADPSVGIFDSQADITSVHAYNVKNELQDLERFFDIDRLEDQVFDYEADCYQDHLEMAAEAKARYM